MFVLLPYIILISYHTDSKNSVFTTLVTFSSRSMERLPYIRYFTQVLFYQYHFKNYPNYIKSNHYNNEEIQNAFVKNIQNHHLVFLQIHSIVKNPLSNSGFWGYTLFMKTLPKMLPQTFSEKVTENHLKCSQKIYLLIF